jgi:hypothetical protein
MPPRQNPQSSPMHAQDGKFPSGGSSRSPASQRTPVNPNAQRAADDKPAGQMPSLDINERFDFGGNTPVDNEPTEIGTPFGIRGAMQEQGGSQDKMDHGNVAGGEIQSRRTPVTAESPSVEVLDAIPRAAIDRDTEIVLASLGVTQEQFYTLKAGGSVSATTTRGQTHWTTRFRFDGKTLSASVVSDNNMSIGDKLNMEVSGFKRQSTTLGQKLGAKDLRLQYEMVGEDAANVLRQQQFKPRPDMDGILRLDIPLR